MRQLHSHYYHHLGIHILELGYSGWKRRFKPSGLALGVIINITVGMRMLSYTHFTGVPRGTFMISYGPSDGKRSYQLALPVPSLQTSVVISNAY
jgi:hypothetical protein